MTTDYYIRAQYLKLIWAEFLIFVLVFVSQLAVSRSRPSVPYGANFCIIVAEHYRWGRL